MSECRLRDVAPDLVTELQTLLVEADECELAAQVEELTLVDRCHCGDDFCGTFYAVPRPDGAWGAGLRTVALHPLAGMINVDIVDDKIAAVEVLYRDEI